MKFSVVTPSFNQAEFLQRCIDSVANQTHPAIEHLLFDPGSNDGSRDIAAAAPTVTLIAEPDEGQGDAVARGMVRASGDIIAWVNSDDEYHDPEVFARVNARFEADPDLDILFGKGIYTGRDDEYLRDAYVIKSADELGWRFPKEVGVLQPATFIRKRLIDRIGPVSKDYHFCMDYEFWIRSLQSGAKFAHEPTNLAKARYWSDNKTLGQRGESIREVMDMLKSKYGLVHVDWVKRYADFVLNNNDGILKNFGNQEIDKDALARLTPEITVAVDGDYDTYHRLRERARDKVWKTTAEAVDSRKDIVAPAFAKPIPLDQQTEPSHQCYTVGERRWAFRRPWLTAQLERSQGVIEKAASQRRGDTCIIVGNGPSLNLTDFKAMEGTDVFITNYSIINKKIRSLARYVCVTNYLVAEQGSHQFNTLEGLTKILPYWLSYCLLPDDNTAYVKSVGFPKFSTDYRENVSWRSTVTFFCMQMAYALGYRKVCMVGFDHSYVQPKNMEEGVVIDQDEDDANHFDPRYFKGKQWQAADTDNMEAMYVLAKEAFEADGREIVNCTVGGKLELFRRGDLKTELAIPPSAAAASAPAPSAAPDEPEAPAAAVRALVLDMTAAGNGTATGEIKTTLMSGGAVEMLQVCVYGGGLALKAGLGGAIEKASEEAVERAIRLFDPQVILYRPVPDSAPLHDFAMRHIRRSRLPLVTWIMDDWPSDLRARDAAAAEALEADWRWLLERSSERLSISEDMSRSFGERYGGTFEAIANGVDPKDWKARPLLIRYGGGLAENMGLASVLRLAQAVETLHQEGYDVRLEILTKPYWHSRAGGAFSALSRTSFQTHVLSDGEYRRWLAGADVLSICYNFDEASLGYVRYSMANKLPECLASGAVLLAHGHPEIATMRRLAELDCAVLVTDPDVAQIADQLRRLANEPEWAAAVASRARRTAFDQFNVSRSRRRLADALARAREATPPAPPRQPARPDTDALRALKDRHRGERCFIMGNGPSLNRLDLDLLKGETVFACNAVHLLFDRIAWRPRYYACVDTRVLQDRRADIAAMLDIERGMTGFFPAELVVHDGSGQTLDTREILGSRINQIFFNEVSNNPSAGVAGMFSTDAALGVVMPYTVTITLMQLAAHMGFKEIYLIGCDTDYVVPASVRRDGPITPGGGLFLTSSQDDDSNHFDPRYFGRDRQWHDPQVDKMIEHYRFAAQALESMGVRVVNATAGGKLEVFPRADFASLFGAAPVRTPATPPTGRAAASSPSAAGSASGLILAEPSQASRSVARRLSDGRPVMVLAEPTDIGEDLQPAYVLAAGPARSLMLERLSRAAHRDSSVRRLLVSGATNQALNRPEKALDLDLLGPVLWPEFAGRPISSAALGLLWAQALGFDSVTLASIGPGAAEPGSVGLEEVLNRVSDGGMRVLLES